MGQQPTKLENIQTQVVSFPDLCQILLLIQITQPCRMSCVILPLRSYMAFETILPVSLIQLMFVPFVPRTSSPKHKYSYSVFLKCFSAFHRYLQKIQEKWGMYSQAQDLMLDDLCLYDFFPYNSWITERCVTCQTSWRCALSNKNFSYRSYRDTNRNL